MNSKTGYIVIVGDSVKFNYAERKATERAAKMASTKAKSNGLTADVIDLSLDAIEEYSGNEFYVTESGRSISAAFVAEILR